MKIEQYVMAYGVEQDRLRAVIPDGFTSIRPVLRINAEIIDENRSYIEFTLHSSLNFERINTTLNKFRYMMNHT